MLPQLLPQRKKEGDKPSFLLVRRAGLEPATRWLKASCSTN